MYRRRDELAAVEHPWVGAETYFVGEVHGGDFYNRWPAECRIVGTRRWAPGNTLEAVDAEFRALLDARRAGDRLRRSSSTCASSAARTRSTSSTSSRARSARRTRR